MYCPYCRWEVLSCEVKIIDRDETQELPQCCFASVELEERNPHCLTRFEMLDLVASRMSAATLHELSNEQLYLICVGMGFVRYPDVPSELAKTWRSVVQNS